MNDHFVERIMRDAEQNQIRASDIKGAQDLEKINWPRVEYYGYDHAKQTSQLAVYIAQTLNVSPLQLSVLKTAALLHDLGRTQPWQNEEPSHAQESARLAGEIMHKDTTAWGDADFIAAVTSLIARHTLRGLPPVDPLLIALWDAECYEAARFVPDTEEGEIVCHQRFSRVITPWAKHPEHQKRWRKYRKWQKP